jgi:hypothetical protein
LKDDRYRKRRASPIVSPDDPSHQLADVFRPGNAYP